MNLKQFSLGRTIGVVAVFVLLGLLAYEYVQAPKPAGTHVVPPVSFACPTDAKICPDGSAVGRTGSDCHFEACPTREATTSTITTTIGQVATALHVSITPKEVVSDSRCPQGVQCIWAGTVEVKAVVATEVLHGENVYKLGESADFGAYTITLIEVTPSPVESVKIPTSSYRFTFKVEKK